MDNYISLPQNKQIIPPFKASNLQPVFTKVIPKKLRPSRIQTQKARLTDVIEQKIQPITQHKQTTVVNQELIKSKREKIEVSSLWNLTKDCQLIAAAIDNYGSVIKGKVQISGISPVEYRKRLKHLLANAICWSKEEEQKLFFLVSKFGYSWKKISDFFLGHDLLDCMIHILSLKCDEKHFTTQEDDILKEYFQKFQDDWNAYNEIFPTKPIDAVRKRVLKITKTEKLRQSKWTDPDDDILYSLINSGVSLNILQQITKIDQETIYKRYRKILQKRK